MPLSSPPRLESATVESPRATTGLRAVATTAYASSVRLAAGLCALKSWMSACEALTLVHPVDAWLVRTCERQRRHGWSDLNAFSSWRGDVDFDSFRERSQRD